MNLSNEQLPKFSSIRDFFQKFKRKEKPMEISNEVKSSKFSFWKSKIFSVLAIILISSFFGFLAGAISSTSLSTQIKDYLQKLNINLSSSQANQPQENKGNEPPSYIPQTSEEKTVIEVVKEVSPAVVSIIISKNLPVMEEYLAPLPDFPFFNVPQYRQKGTQKQEIGGGSGFLVSEDGLVLTNKHVASIEGADYTVLTNDGKKFPAKILAIDPAQDLAVLKIEGNNFPIVKLGNSDTIEIGQTVIAIGNALGEFRNTVSVGIISGLGRTITASGGGVVETLEDVIQTDAAINQGNSGGPLLNLRGEVVGVNTATAVGAENISFAIPINKAKRDIEQVKASGKIIYPFLGVRYVIITDQIQKDNNLPVNYGALVARSEQTGEAAIFPGSPAQKAGLEEGDIILEFNNEKINTDNSLAKIIIKYNPGDQVTLKILRNGQEKTVSLNLGERSE